MPDVVGGQPSGGVTAGNCARAVAVLERTAKPPIDQPRGTTGANDLAVTFEPDFAGGITGQVSTFGVGEQRTQMQCRSTLFDVDVHHYGGVLPVRASRRIGVPAGLDEAHKRLAGGGQRGSLIWSARAIAVIVLPLGDQRIPVRRQSGVELRGVMMAKGDAVATALLIAGGGDRVLGLWPRSRFGPRLQSDRGAQLIDRRTGRQLRVMLVGSLAGSCRNDADLIGRQSTLSH